MVEVMFNSLPMAYGKCPLCKHPVDVLDLHFGASNYTETECLNCGEELSVTAITEFEVRWNPPVVMG